MHGLVEDLHAQADRLVAGALERARELGGDEALGRATLTVVPIRDAWKEALSTAFSLAKADRARELRGDRTVARFNEQGLHPFSAEWGRLMALEALQPGLSDVREKLKVDDNGEVTELFVSTRVLRLEAREAAEEEFRVEIIAQHSATVLSEER